MPRQAPTQVIEHRLSLQDAERKQLLEPVGAILTDVQKFTAQANQMRMVATYGTLALGGAALWYVPKVWKETTELIAGVAGALNPLSYPERFVDYFETRGVPTGIIGDFIKNRL